MSSERTTRKAHISNRRMSLVNFYVEWCAYATRPARWRLSRIVSRHPPPDPLQVCNVHSSLSLSYLFVEENVGVSTFAPRPSLLGVLRVADFSFPFFSPGIFVPAKNPCPPPPPPSSSPPPPGKKSQSERSPLLRIHRFTASEHLERSRAPRRLRRRRWPESTSWVPNPSQPPECWAPRNPSVAK